MLLRMSARALYVILGTVGLVVLLGGARSMQPVHFVGPALKPRYACWEWCMAGEAPLGG